MADINKSKVVKKQYSGYSFLFSFNDFAFITHKLGQTQGGTSHESKMWGCYVRETIASQTFSTGNTNSLHLLNCDVTTFVRPFHI